MKPLSRLLILIILVCGLSFQFSYVSGIFTPSIPKFTVELVAYPYDVPPVTTTEIDEYTGEKTVVTTPGYRVENMSIELVIKNQPFTPFISLVDTPYNVDIEKEINLYYNVRVKGHFGQDWQDSLMEVVPSNSEYTVLSLPADYPDGAKVDFQVEAILGFYYNDLGGRLLPPMNTDFMSAGLSGWSSTQTLTINWNNALVFGEPEETGDTETPDPSTPSDDTIMSDEPTSSEDTTSYENTTTSNEQGTLDLAWVPKDESSEVEEFAAIFGIASVVAALAVGLFVYFRIRKD